MYRTKKDFLVDYQYESEKTLAVIRACQDLSLSLRTDPNSFSLGEAALHITQAIVRIAKQLDLKVDPISESGGAQTDTNTLAGLYQRTADSLISSVCELSSDEALLEEKDVYHYRWTVGQGLLVLVKHEVHHRAQMVAGLRHAGLSSPDIYGPARR